MVVTNSLPWWRLWQCCKRIADQRISDPKDSFKQAMHVKKTCQLTENASHAQTNLHGVLIFLKILLWRSILIFTYNYIRWGIWGSCSWRHPLTSSHTFMQCNNILLQYDVNFHDMLYQKVFSLHIKAISGLVLPRPLSPCFPLWRDRSRQFCGCYGNRSFPPLWLNFRYSLLFPRTFRSPNVRCESLSCDLSRTASVPAILKRLLSSLKADVDCRFAVIWFCKFRVECKDVVVLPAVSMRSKIVKEILVVLCFLLKLP